MDFVQLAEATSIKAVRRYLQSYEDDDFSHLDTTHTSNHEIANDSILAVTKSMINTADVETENPPMLSPVAETELFMLATNFLLCTYSLPFSNESWSLRPIAFSNFKLTFLLYCHLDVAIVLIITMVAKIYFPESLERGQPVLAAPSTRTFSYRRVTDEEAAKNGGNYYSSDEEEESEKPLVQSKSNGSMKSKGEYSIKSSASQLSDVLEFEQENTSKAQVLKRLALCVLMLNVTFVTWGVLQERMLTRRYPRYTGEFFIYSYALVFTNRFWTLIMSGMLMLYLRPTRSSSTVIYEYSFPSISNMLSSWCQYEALRYVSFPAVTLFKSFKLMPVMLMGKFLGNKQCECVCACSFTFFTASDKYSNNLI